MSDLAVESNPTEVARLGPPAPDGAPLSDGPRRGAAAVLATGWVLGACLLVWLLYLAAVHAVAGSADNATVLLEGQAISHGNLALGGWSLSLDSFWLVDALFYGAAVVVTGLHPGLMFFVPALLAALVIVVAVLIARRDSVGRAGIAATATVVALLALPGPDLAYYLLQGPWHIGTVLWCLLAFLGLSSGRFGWGWVAAVLLLACALLGDLLIVGFGILPSVAAGIAAMLRSRRWRAGAAPIGAALASVAVAGAIRAIASLAGTFSLVNRNIVVRLPRVAANVGHLPNRVGAMLGVGAIPFKDRGNGALAFQVFHVVGLVLLCAGLLAGIVALGGGMFRARPFPPQIGESWRIDDLLVFGVIGDLALFVWASPSGNFEYAKYLTAAVVFGAILAARLVGHGVGRIRSTRRLALVAVAGAIVIGAFAVEFERELVQPVPPQPTIALGRFLAAHGLHVGVGDYWSSSLVTVETDGEVAVRPVEANASGHLIRFDRQSSVDWYRGTRFQFFVYDTAQPWHGVNAMSATASFGPPDRTYDVGSYRVLVWPHRLSVPIGPPSTGSPLELFFR